jgi:hypothetical protein
MRKSGSGSSSSHGLNFARSEGDCDTPAAGWRIAIRFLGMVYPASPDRRIVSG